MGNFGVWNVDDKGIEHKGSIYSIADGFENVNEKDSSTESARFKKAMTQLNDIEEIFNKTLSMHISNENQRNSFFDKGRNSMSKNLKFEQVPKE